MDLLIILIFLFSAFLLIWVGAAITKSYARNIKDAFWIMNGTLYLQISAIPLFLSIFSYLNIYGFLGCQMILAALIFIFKKHRTDFHFTFNKVLNFDKIEKSLFVLAILLLSLHLAHRIFMPLVKGDVLVYHAPRILYWIQNSSLAPYQTMNDLQITFAFGSDLIFMWPILFTKAEFVGKIIFSLGFPAAATGFYTVLRLMYCSKKLSLLGLNIFLSLPIVYNFGLSLEPLIWLSLFALGAGYWALRVGQTSARNLLFIFWLGIYCILVGNTKFNGVMLIPAGAVVVLLVALFHNSSAKRFRVILKCLVTYTLAAFIGLALSGLGFLLTQNMVLYSDPFVSDLRREEIFAEFSPYQIYVHTIRTAAVLAEMPPFPIGYEFLKNFGNKVIKFLGADKPLPKEEQWKYVGHYKYGEAKWPGRTNFGIAGLFILLIFITTVVSGVKRLIKRDLSKLWESLKKSEKLPYIVLAFSLFLLNVYIVRWIVTGTRSYLAPGIVCILPLALSFLNHKQIPKKVLLAVFVIFIIFSSAFAMYQGYKLVRIVREVGFDWSRIAYTQKSRLELIEKNVPEEATLILLVHRNFMDYTMFGKHYTRMVIQVTTPFTKKKIAEIVQEFPSAYIYVHQSRYEGNVELLESHPDISLIGHSWDAKLFKLIADKRGESPF